MSEGLPVNNVGSGNIAGTGVGLSGEPGIKPKSKKIMRRKTPVNEIETFAGVKVFDVEPNIFFKAKLSKRKYARWSDYVGSNEIGEDIRSFAYSNPENSIIVRNKLTKEMMFLKYGKTRFK